MGIFEELVYELVRQIPKGMVSTYGEIARALGDVRAARAVGEALRRNPSPENAPCHRVVMGDGSLGGYAFGGPEEKRRKLLEEGVPFRGNKVDLSRALFRDFRVKNPIFLRMREAQMQLFMKRREEPVSGELFAGVDVAYSGDLAIAAAVVYDLQGHLVERKHAILPVSFPYVPTYLAFREMAPVALALEGLDYDILLVDGHGLIHPRFAGEAVHFGVVLDMPSIGVAKSFLTGRVVGQRVYIGEVLVGYKVGSAYVSPGNYFRVEEALRWAKVLWGKGKQPLPLLEAHKYANEVKKMLKLESVTTKHPHNVL